MDTPITWIFPLTFAATKKCAMKRLELFFLLSFALLSCEHLDDDMDRHGGGDEPFIYIDLGEVAQLLAASGFEKAQADEVFTAVSSSSGNGYDEEYTLQDLFSSPGAGVGEDVSKAGGTDYEKPLRSLLEAAIREKYGSKAEGGIDADMYLEALRSSDVQIYWPFSECWDVSSMPIVAAAPEDMSEVVWDWDSRGEKVALDEETASEQPVWVINRNNDAGFTSLELLRRRDPSWGEGGGDILVRGARGTASKAVRTLVLRSFRAYRNYDPWYLGGSEFFIKCGSVDEFYASTEAEMALYSPSITDFMIVMKRSEVNTELPFNAILVSDWTEKLHSCAFLVTEDDGGTVTKWDCSAIVKINSKGYGIEMSIPVKTKDDIVWRGQLTAGYIEKYSGTTARFGDVDLVLELI